jgi:hypothetical protein
LIIVLSDQGRSAQQEENHAENERHSIVDRAKYLLNGFVVGDSRVFPYASLDDWFDPVVGLKLEHRAFRNREDRMRHHFKFENFNEYSWKFRYLLNSLSIENTKFSFLFKIKINDDDYFYGTGNSTSKSERRLTTYSSVFVGWEATQLLSENMALRFSPGLWKFKSGLVSGGEFEEASDAQYISSRVTLSDITSIDYWKGDVDHKWSAYAEIALPINTSVATYTRFNIQTTSQFPLPLNTKLRIESRAEYLVSTNRDMVPYFALPEVGSKTGLRGFSKERFRNFAMAVLNFEVSFPIMKSFDGFLLTDLAKTGSNPGKVFGEKIHAGFGLGFRIRDANHPLSFGLARSTEDWKLFTDIALGNPW